MNAPGLRRYQSFTNARAFVRGLGLTSQTEWNEYCGSEKKPADIPAAPEWIYSDKGWAGMSDWLGNRRMPRGQHRSFTKARAFVRVLGLKSMNEWRDYRKSGKKPDDLPYNPDVFYANDGWSGWGDWLGTGTIAPGLRQYRSFKAARSFAHGLNLKSFSEWRLDYCKSGKRPDDVPAQPQIVYANDGWSGWGDWLGTGNISNRLRPYRSFEAARTFVRGLNLKSSTKWRDYCKSGKKPDDIPAKPDRTYANSGWVGYSDWLGSGGVVRGQFRSFTKARAFVRGLGLKSNLEWRDYCKSGKKPADLPAGPGRVYSDSGWAGFSDWLGNGRVVRRSTSIFQAGARVRA
jgi:hypothetical protein